MNKLFLAAGVAALALAAPVAAEKGQGGGKGNKGQSAKLERGNGGNAKAERGAFKVERSGFKAERQAFKAEKKAFKAENKAFKAEGKAFKAERKNDRAVTRFAKQDSRDFNRFGDGDGDFFVAGRGAAFANGCPPGLMDKGCMPPGQAQKLAGSLLPASYRDRLLPLGLRDLYRDDDDYFYRLGTGGYVYRVDRDTNLISALLPLFGGGLMTGQQFPSAYSNYMVPSPYQAFYPESSDNYYRYANGYVYGIDRGSGLIENMIPLMANGYGMGQMLPASYSAYNVPYQYRDMYADNNDYMYRYAPGAIYQVDPTTRLITGVASLLTGNGLSVGQQLPAGYGAYNVPLGYRDQYADSSDAWYRYNNGNIYQVDPTTQLVTAIIRAIV